MYKITYHTVRCLDTPFLKKTCVTQNLCNLGYKITKNYSTLLQLGRDKGPGHSGAGSDSSGAFLGSQRVR